MKIEETNSQMNTHNQNDLNQIFQQERCTWESAIVNYNGIDPLDLWYNYICWYEQNAANDMEQKFVTVVERCLSEFDNNENYKQDLRMIKIWKKYIDMQRDPLSYYNALFHRGIGTQCAIFYIEWAMNYISLNAYKQAETVYNLAFQAKAQPHEELILANKKFRYDISKSIKKRASSSLGEQKQLNTCLRPPNKKQKLENETQFYNGENEYQQYDESRNYNNTSNYNNNYEMNTNNVTPVVQSYSNLNNFDNANEINSNIDTNSQQCDLNNSAYVISSSLNYVYDDSSGNYYNANTSEYQPVKEEADGIKLPLDFVRYAKNNDVSWTAPLFLAEPHDPNRCCMYPKHLVYQNEANEISLEELKANKWRQNLIEINRNNQIKAEQEYARIQNEQIQQERAQNERMQQERIHEYERLQQERLHKERMQMELMQQERLQQEHIQQECFQQERFQQERLHHDAQMQQHTQIYQQPQPQEIQQQIPPQQYYHQTHCQEDQSASEYIQNNSNYNGSLKQTNGIAPSASQNYTVSISDNKEELSKSDDIEDQIEASTISFCSNNGLNKSKKITIKFKKEKPSIQNSTPNVPSKSKRKSKSRKYYDEEAGSYTTQSKKQNGKKKPDQYQVTQNNIDDANLLLSISNINNDDSLSCSYSMKTNTTTQDQYPSEDSFSNSDFNTSFTSISYSGENSNGTGCFNYNNSSSSTPVKTNHRYIPDNISKSLTPNNFKLLKTRKSNISNQNDDSMCSYVGDQNSMLLDEGEEKEKRMTKAITTIENHFSKPIIDPFSNELCKAFLTKIDYPSPYKCVNCKFINNSIPKMITMKNTTMGDVLYSVEKEVGRGAYGAVYRAVNVLSGAVVAIKYQKPPTAWEMYICSEVRNRIKNHDILPGFMDISAAVMALNASVLVSEFSPYGSLLDINNRVRQATTKVMHESLVMHFTSQILNIIHHLHSCNIIHADIKPDNFLLMKIPCADSHVPTIRLIDFGCAIDMTFFKPGTQFQKVIQTDGFTCTEMLEGRPWSFQTDLFCVAGTIHVMLFGEYMQLVKKFGTEWDIKQKLPRYLKKHVWSEFFPKLLNIKGLDNLPNLQDMKSLIDNELYNMESELVKQIRSLSNILHKR